MKDARISMIIAMTIFGTIGVFVRYIPLSSGELALYRAIMAVLLIGGYLLFSRQKISWKETQQSLFLLLVSGIAIGANWILLFEAYRYTTISTATLSYYFAPVIVMIVSPILFRERLTAKQIICFLLSAIGLVLTTNINIPDKNNHDLIGILFGLSAAFFYALAVILNKFIQNVNGIHRTFLQFLAAICILLPYVFATSGNNLHTLNPAGWGCLLIVGVIHTGISYCLYFSSLKTLPGQKAAILSYIDPLVAVLMSVLILHEQMSVMQYIGGGLILGATLWNEISFGANTSSRR